MWEHESLITDSLGQASLDVPVGVALRLNLEGQLPNDTEEYQVDALVSGQVLQLGFSLPFEPDLRLFGRVVAREGRAPIPGARVVVPNEGLEVEADADGRFEVAARSTHSPQALIDAPGFARARVNIIGMHAARESELLVRDTGLEPGSDWNRREGVLLSHPEAIVLVPGEERDLRLQAPSRHSLSGRLKRDEGGVVRGVQVRLARRDSDASRRALRSGLDLFAEATTDRDGLFEFEGVPTGSWWIGVSPDNRREYDSTAIPIEVGEGIRTVELVTHRGLQLRGEIQSPAGEPLSGAHVYANPEGAEGSRFVLTGADGHLTFRGLTPGPHNVSARPPAVGSEQMGSGKLRATPGDDDVVITLSPAGSLSGRVDSIPPASGALRLFASRRGGSGSSSSPSRAGEFAYAHLRPDIYDLFATTESGYIGILPGIELAAGGRSSMLRCNRRLPVSSPATGSQTPAPVASRLCNCSLPAFCTCES